MTERPHDPKILPDNLPVPQDDGAARHLHGARLPDIVLAGDRRPRRSICRALTGRTVVYVYPRTGRPGQAMPTGWDGIPGARGCTPQSCSFRDHFAELKALGVKQLYGLSTQDTRLSARGGGAAAPAVPDPVGRIAAAHPRA